MPELFVQSPIGNDQHNKSYETLDNDEFKVLATIRYAEDSSMTLESEPDFQESNWVCKTDSTMPKMMAVDMLLSSIDISYFALPMVIQETGWFLSLGFFFQMMFFSLMAAQVFIELKRLANVTRSTLDSNSDQNEETPRRRRRKYVGIMELIEECTQSSTFSPSYMTAVRFYLKFIVISTLIMLLASNQAFSTVIFD